MPNPRPMRHFNVFDDVPQRIDYHGSPTDIHVVQRSPDGRHMTFYGAVPDGVRFTEVPGELEETFYIIEGTVTCTPKGGQTVVWGPGDLVYWPYDTELELEYSAGMRCICFFWSEATLPDYTVDAS